MTDSPSRLHHVVFAVARERHDTVGQLFTELGFSFNEANLDELGIRVLLDWDRGIELISPNLDFSSRVISVGLGDGVRGVWGLCGLGRVGVVPCRRVGGL
ncbi:hypothetical protein H7J50_29245, partial [Mycobacterium intermedium]|nr:hypothetical protein [Mycobacterium intermedium]